MQGCKKEEIRGLLMPRANEQMMFVRPSVRPSVFSLSWGGRRSKIVRRKEVDALDRSSAGKEMRGGREEGREGKGKGLFGTKGALLCSAVASLQKKLQWRNGPSCGPALGFSFFLLRPYSTCARPDDCRKALSSTAAAAAVAVGTMGMCNAQE